MCRFHRIMNSINNEYDRNSACVVQRYSKDAV